MATIFIIWIWTVIGVNSCGVDSASIYGYKMDCTDRKCAEGYFCVEHSHMCARCIECNVYKRTSSWLDCPKQPADCGKCLPGYEEEILAGGKSRDFCVDSAHASSQTEMVHSAYKNVQNVGSAHYFLVVGLLLFLVPTAFYVFYWKRRSHGRRHCQQSSHPHGEPPTYQSSIELTPVLSISDSGEDIEAIEASSTLVMNITHTKDRVTEATPFRCADYEEHENTYNTEVEEAEAEEEYMVSRVVTGNLELEDENTMPSDWTPDRALDSNQQESEQQQQVIESEDQDCCQPRNKRRRKEPEDPDGSDSSTPQQQQQQQQQSINLFFTNNIIIKKED